MCIGIAYPRKPHELYRGIDLGIRLNILEGWTPPKQRMHVDTSIVIKSNLDSYLDGSDQLMESNLERQVKIWKRF